MKNVLRFFSILLVSALSESAWGMMGACGGEDDRHAQGSPITRSKPALKIKKEESVDVSFQQLTAGITEEEFQKLPLSKRHFVSLFGANPSHPSQTFEEIFIGDAKTVVIHFFNPLTNLDGIPIDPNNQIVTQQIIDVAVSSIRNNLQHAKSGNAVTTLALKNFRPEPLQIATYKALQDRFPVNRLNLDRNVIDDKLPPLFSIRCFGTDMTTLSLSQTGVSPEILTQILRELPHLSRLNISHNKFKNEQMDYICHSPAFKKLRLTSLDVSYNMIDDAGLFILMYQKSLLGLNLLNNQIGDITGCLLSRQIKENAALRYISVKNNPMSEEVQKDIVGSRSPFADMEKEAAQPSSLMNSPLKQFKNLFTGVGKKKA